MSPNDIIRPYPLATNDKNRKKYMCTLASWLATRRQTRTLSKTSYPDSYKTTRSKMSRYAPPLTNARNSPRSSIVPSQQITKQNTMFISLRLSMVYSLAGHLYYTL
ncbi:hypothetical protein G6F46_007079 [Rhizopus delemar]|nr:hypothetical protein G6F55_009527 [Rhizopus delemar]KAG1498246.1 hypothetical protein G6F52_012777 [Rhizopus delemar]KAG1505619.1 hypothetical protein G6F53_010145 [Rhizopus delemar]KAG1614272.1 hypothetical protein G6F46_007079 [Rhizopus delemar]KAG1628708.1 hypothetical protein G6F45_006730 [Rhizopus arrhizus]